MCSADAREDGEGVGGRLVVLGASPTVAEGDAGVAVAVVEWPDMETLQAW
jgi:uncharacterized protein (DUF1330 family)